MCLWMEGKSWEVTICQRILCCLQSNFCFSDKNRSDLGDTWAYMYPSVFIWPPCKPWTGLQTDIEAYLSLLLKRHRAQILYAALWSFRDLSKTYLFSSNSSILVHKLPRLLKLPVDCLSGLQKAWKWCRSWLSFQLLTKPVAQHDFLLYGRDGRHLSSCVMEHNEGVLTQPE